MTNLIQTIEADIVAAWGELETTVETDATVVWNDFKVSFLAVLPQEYADIKAAIVGIVEKGFMGDIAGIETELLDLGTETVALVAKLGSSTVQAIIGVVASAHPAVAAATAKPA